MGTTVRSHTTAAGEREQLAAPAAAARLRLRPSLRHPLRGIAPRAVFETALIVLGVFMQAAFFPHGATSDGYGRYVELSQLLDKGILTSGKYSLIGPLFSTPLYLLGRLYHSPSWAISYYNAAVFAIGLLALYLLLKDAVDRRLLRIFLLLLVTTTLFPQSTLDFFGEPFTAVCVGVGLVAVVFRRSWRGWVVIALGVANTPASLVGLALAAAGRVLFARRLWPLLAVVLAGALVGLENFIRRGSPTNSGYEAGFGYPIVIGLISIFFSYGKGLIFFTPGLLLPIRSRLLGAGDDASRRLYQVYLLWMAFLAGMILVYSDWWAWFGGWWWGPRFFLIACLPASLALAIYLRSPSHSLLVNLAVLAVLALSIWVGINGLIFGLQGLNICTRGYNYLIPLCVYNPQYSELWRAFLVPLPFGKRDVIYCAYSLVAFGYLALPVARAIAHQARETASAYRAHGGLRTWRF